LNYRTNKRAGATTLAATLLAALALAACGSDETGEESDPGNFADAPSFEPALAKAPAELDALYEDAGQILPGGSEALDSTLAELEGYPVVVNVWASWCGPCRAELPHLQEAAAERLDEIAFIGINSNDSDEAAETFLSDHPMPYPSFADPGYDVARELDPRLIAQPNTVFIDREGEVVHIKSGPYESTEDLNTDIEKYALSS